MMPEFQKAAKILQEQDNPVTIAKVDATTTPNLADKYQIQGYPTIKLFLNGEAYDYTGQRVADSIVQWVTKKSGPLLNYSKSHQYLQSVIDNNSMVAILFYDDEKGGGQTLLEIYERVARHFPQYFFFGSNRQAASEFGIENLPDFVLFRDFDQPMVRLGPHFTYDNVMEFLESHRNPIVQNFNIDISDQLFSKQQSGLILFASDDEASKWAIDAVQDSALLLRGKLLVTVSTITDELGKRMAEYFAITQNDLPHLMIIQFIENDMKKFKYPSNNINKNDIVDFVDQWTSGVILPHQNSQSIPQNDYDGNVRVIVGSNFFKVIKDTNYDVLVLLYAPVARLMKASNPQIMLAQMDASENEVEGLQINGFPTIKFYSAGDKFRPETYEGDRSQKGLIQFLKQNASFDWQDPVRNDL